MEHAKLLALAREWVGRMYQQNLNQNLIEQNWLLTRGLQDEQPVFQEFVRLAVQREVPSFLGFSSDISHASVKDLESEILNSRSWVNAQIEWLSQISDADRKVFLSHVVEVMSEVVRFEVSLANQRQSAERLYQQRLLTRTRSDDWRILRRKPEEGLLPASSYRAFDRMDEMLEIHYDQDLGMPSLPDQHERLFEGAGSGVQSSYATILLVMQSLRLASGQHIVDLGSGYGRVGLTAALWRADLRFTGYEFVEHRVAVASRASRRAGVEERVRFLHQDLSDLRFSIPDADVYYLYDPFCVSTYGRVLSQIVEIGSRRSIQVVTKAGASDAFLEKIAGLEWSVSPAYEEGNLHIFKSRG